MVILIEDLRTRLTNVHNATTGTTTCSAHHRAHQEDPKANDEEPGQETDQRIDPRILLKGVFHRRFLLGRELLQVLAQLIDRTDRKAQLCPLLGHRLQGRGHTVGAVFGDRGLGQIDRYLAVVHHYKLIDLPLPDHRLDHLPRTLHGVSLLTAKEPRSDDKQTDHRIDPHEIDAAHGIIFLFCHSLLLVFVTYHGGIGPQLLEFVEVAQLALEDVYDDIHIVHSHPGTDLLTLHTPGPLAHHLVHLLLDAVGNGRRLHRRIGIADHKVRADRPIEARQVERYNILTFFILDCRYNRINQLLFSFHNLQ